MQLIAFGAALVVLYILQIIATRMMALTPEKLTKAALRINACNAEFGRRLIELNRQSSGNWAESVNYGQIVAEWIKAASKILKYFDYLHHAKENTDYRLPLLLIGEPIIIEGVSIPDKFTFRVADAILKDIAKGTKSREDVILKVMAEQISPTGSLSTRFWAFRAHLLASGQINADTAPPEKAPEKFALLSALHVSFGFNSRNRLLKARWNTPRIILETAVYALFPVCRLFCSLVAEHRPSQANDILIWIQYRNGLFRTDGFLSLTHWACNSLVSYSLQALCQCQKVSIGHRNPAKVRYCDAR
jgi:hypothetical protein